MVRRDQRRALARSQIFRSLARLTAPIEVFSWWLKGATTIRQVVHNHGGHGQCDQNNPDDSNHVLNPGVDAHMDPTSSMPETSGYGML